MIDAYVAVATERDRLHDPPAEDIDAPFLPDAEIADMPLVEWHERGDDVIAVEVVHHPSAAGAQRRANGAEDFGVLAVGLEVAETREEVDDDIERARLDNLAHVAPDESNIDAGVRCRGARLVKQVAREIESGHPIAAPGEFDGMTAAAAGEIEHPRTGHRPGARAP